MFRALRLLRSLALAASALVAARAQQLERTPLLDRLAPAPPAAGEAMRTQDLVLEQALADFAPAPSADDARAWFLPLPAARDERGEPLAFELLDRDGRAVAAGGRRRPLYRLVAAEQVVDCLHHRSFRGFERRRFQTAEEPNLRAMWIDRDAEFELEFERSGAPARLALVGAIVGGFRAELSPRVTLLVDGSELATKDCSRRDELARPFELPAALGPQTLRLRVTYPSGEAAPPRLALARVKLAEERPRDRLLFAAGADPAGFRVRYRALPPPAVRPLPARRPQRIAGLAGEALVVVDPPQPLAFALDGVAQPSSSLPVRELAVTFATSGEHELEWLAPAAPSAGKAWLVQPAILAHVDLSLGRAPLPRAALAAAPPVAAPTQRERDARPTLVLAAGSTTELDLPAGPAGRIEAALAVEALGCDDVAFPPAEVTFALVAADGAITPLGTRRVAARAAWNELELALPAVGAGARLRVEAGVPEDMPLFGRVVRFLLADPAVVRETEGPRRRNVLVYLIDTLRADHCSTYGYARRTTPALDELAARGIVFERAYAQAPWTRPAVATIFSGLLYPFHGAGKLTGLAEGVETLAERMRASGRATAAFVANPHVYAGALQFERGFSRFVTEDARDQQFRSDQINADVVPWLERHARERFFLYVHTVDPHAAYDPPEATRGTFSDRAYAGPIVPPRTQTELLRERVPLPAADLQHVLDLYDEEILFNDRQLGVLMRELERLGVYDETLVIVLSDHGEQFAEHGTFGHAGALWEELLRVPLVMKPPKSCGLVPARVASPARQIDVVPTVLAWLDAAPGAPVQGVDLGPWIRAGAGEPREPLWVIAHEEPGMRCLVLDRMKLIQDGMEEGGEPRTLLFDLAADPREQHDLAAERGDVATQMAARFEALMKGFDEAGFARRDGRRPVELGEQERAALRKLGYAGE